MEIGSVLLVLSLILLVAAFVARPLWEHATRPDDQAATSDLVTQREAILAELRELDFDHSTGKVVDDDYHAQRTRLVLKGADILRSLDQLPRTQAAAPAPDELDANIELLVTARRHAAAPAQPTASGQCPNCHKAILPGDKFCASCGAKLV